MNLSTGLKNNLLSLMGMRPLLNGGCIWLFSGDPPDSADYAASGSLLGAITTDGQVPNLPTNGLTFSYVVQGVMGKAPDETWSLYVNQEGDAGWFRFTGPKGEYADYSKTAVRLDGVVGTELSLSNTHIVAGLVQPIKSFLLYL